MRKLVDDLRDAKNRDPNPWDETLYERAADEIEQLIAQLERAHAILASEQLMWIICGTNHLDSHVESLKPAVSSYWKDYGSYGRDSD